jgi:hypothetical protein
MTPSQIAAVRKIVAAILGAIKAAGDLGAPAGVLYAGLMSQGCSHSQFTSLMASMERGGFITNDDDLYHITPAGLAFTA